MIFHYFGLHLATCHQPLDLPCEFNDTVSSIRSVGSLVQFYFMLSYTTLQYQFDTDLLKIIQIEVITKFINKIYL